MSNELTEILIALLMWANGLLLGYLIWSPTTNFKQGIIDGMTSHCFRKKQTSTDHQTYQEPKQ